MLPRKNADQAVLSLSTRKREESGSTRFERLRFFSEDSRLTMENVALAAKLASILFILFSVLDYLVYPEHFYEFLILRVICAMICVVVGYCSTMPWSRRRFRIFAMMIPLVTAWFLALMIFSIGDPGTSYYAGLNLCILGTGTLFQWTSREAIITSLIVFGMFLFATMWHFGEATTPESVVNFVGNCFFIIATAILVICSAYNHNNFRFKEFVTRSDLRRNQTALELKNRKLKETHDSLRNTERQLYQSDKMSFLGQLSAGVIHEVANPLNFSNQALFILRKRSEKLSGGEELIPIIEDIQEGLDRMKGIISDLREFSHSGNSRGERFDLADSVAGALRILRNVIEEAGVEVEFREGPTEIVGVKNQITQVFSNLIHNAVQAMEKQNDLPRKLRIRFDTRGDDQVGVLVSDTGPGISGEDINKLFDPFFTTKEPGSGTGLGLSICYRIIEAHGGDIRVESDPGEETTFSVWLPIRGNKDRLKEQ